MTQQELFEWLDELQKEFDGKIPDWLMPIVIDWLRYGIPSPRKTMNQLTFAYQKYKEK